METFPPDLAALAVAAGAFMAGGLVKGVTGIGLPLVAVPVLAIGVEPAVAVALMCVPVTAANLWQLWQERAHLDRALRLWPVVLTLIPVTLFATGLLAGVDQALAAALLGAAVLLFCATQLLPAPPRIPPRAEPWVSPLVGAAAGLIGGVSNFFGPPLIMYLSALRLERDAFVAAIALLFVCGGLPLYGGLAARGVLDAQVALLSAAGAAPMFVGVLLGRRVRMHIPPETFQRVLMAVLALIGLNLLRRGLL